MNSEKNPVSGFLTDPEFVRWVQHPDRELDIYWLKWMEANPDKREDLKLAREIIKGFHFKTKLPDPSEKQALLANILNKDSNIGKVDEDKAAPIKHSTSTIWDRLGQTSKVAAMLTLAVALSFIVNYLTREPA